jgi:hypothetical protein
MTNGKGSPYPEGLAKPRAGGLEAEITNNVCITGNHRGQPGSEYAASYGKTGEPGPGREGFYKSLYYNKLRNFDPWKRGLHVAANFFPPGTLQIHNMAIVFNNK